MWFLAVTVVQLSDRFSFSNLEVFEQMPSRQGLADLILSLLAFIEILDSGVIS
jgi:hypothetical protein